MLFKAYKVYAIINGKETLSDNDVLEIQYVFTSKDSHEISIKECEDKIELNKIWFPNSHCYYKDNILYIVYAENKNSYIKESDILQITEEQSDKIENTKFSDLSINNLSNIKLPNWAVKYLCNNTDNEGLKILILSYSDLKFFT